jgi:ATP phosphoribosyltransferase regulatory subunit HisZ
MMNDSTNRSETMQKLAEERKASQEDIKNLLGDDKFQQYQDFTLTLGDRMMLDQFAKQSDLQPGQTEQLLAAITEEKKNAQINQPVAPGSDQITRETEMLNGNTELIQQQIDQQKAVNQNVLDRARQILSPDQLVKFQEHLKNQEAMMEASAKMMEKFSNGGNPPEPVK